MPLIKSSFVLRSAAPNFERDSFASLEEMKGCKIGEIDDGHISYCEETRHHYTFNSKNIWSEEVGFWTKFEPGDQTNLNESISNLTNITDEIYAYLFPLSCKITPQNKGNVVEYTGNNIDVVLNLDVIHKGESLGRENVDDIIFSTINEEDIIKESLPIDKTTEHVQVELKASKNADHKFKMETKAIKQIANAECTIYQRMPTYIGWSSNQQPDGLFISESTDLIKRLIVTTVKDTYHFGEIGEGYYFWILIPEGVEGFSNIIANRFNLIIEEPYDHTFEGMKYKCYRTPEKSEVKSNNWEIILS